MAERALHRRIAADLERRVAAGEWLPGDQLPSRADFAAEYHVHPQTVRLAIILLRRQGVVEGTQRQRLWVAYPPAVRALTDFDGDWPHGSEVTDTGGCRATAKLASRLDVPECVNLHREMRECWDPNGRSALLVTTWWHGLRRRHESAVVEVEAIPLDVEQAQALRLTVDTVAYRLARTRLDAEGRPVETADLILPMDRWVLRLRARPRGSRND